MGTRFNIKGKPETEVVELLKNLQENVESEKRYHDLLDNMMEGFQVLGFDWRYLYVNNSVVKQSKYPKDDLLDHTLLEKYPGIENSDMFAVLNLCMNARIAQTFENKFTYPDGSIGWFELYVQPVPEGISILSMDITSRKKAEDKNREHIKALEQMLFITSHKVRQPLSQILGITSLIENYPDLPDELSKMLAYIKQSALSLDDYTKELTNYLHLSEMRSRKE